MRTTMLGKLALASCLALTAAFAGREARADGAFSLDNNLTVEVLTTDPSISVIDVIAGPVDVAFFLEGNAGIGASASSAVSASGMGLVTVTHVEGFVIGPQPASVAAALALAEGSIIVENTGTTDVTIDLGLTLDFFVGMIAFDDLTTVTAFLSFAVFLDPTDSSPGTFLAGDAFFASFTGPGALIFGDTFSFTVPVVLTPGTHTIFVDPLTIGIAAIPEPSTVISAALGMIVLAGAGLRRRSAIASRA